MKHLCDAITLWGITVLIVCDFGARDSITALVVVLALASAFHDRAGRGAVIQPGPVLDPSRHVLRFTWIGPLGLARMAVRAVMRTAEARAALLVRISCHCGSRTVLAGRAIAVGRTARWWVAGLVTAAAFGLAAGISGAFLLPVVMRSAADRWVVAAGLGVAVAALAALWGQSWATREDGGEVRGHPARPGATAAGERSVAASGDISGIASTGDGATNIQQG